MGRLFTKLEFCITRGIAIHARLIVVSRTILAIVASWEKGLTYVAEGSITSDEYMQKLENFVAGRTANVLRLNNQYGLRGAFDAAAANYKKTK